MQDKEKMFTRDGYIQRCYVCECILREGVYERASKYNTKIIYNGKKINYQDINHLNEEIDWYDKKWRHFIKNNRVEYSNIYKLDNEFIKSQLKKTDFIKVNETKIDLNDMDDLNNINYYHLPNCYCTECVIRLSLPIIYQQCPIIKKMEGNYNVYYILAGNNQIPLSKFMNSLF